MLSKFRGCFLGLALGDALGAPFEGSGCLGNDVSDRILNRNYLEYTDDTIMALCIARSIISVRNIDPSDIAENYAKWFLSEDLRGIGITVFNALSNYVRSRDWKSCGVIDFWAAGNGVAMRVAPIALFDLNSSEETLYEHIRLDGWITHKNELAISGAFAVALAIRQAIKSSSKREVADYVKAKLEEFGILNRVYDAVLNAIKLSSENIDDLKAFVVLGTSGYVVHTVASAIYAFLTKDSYIETILSLIRAGGDTDTNAAVAGAIAGAFYGCEKIPSELIEKLEDKDEILKIADELYALVMNSH